MRSLFVVAIAAAALAGCAPDMKDACASMPAFCDSKEKLAEAKPAPSPAAMAEAKPEKKKQKKAPAPAPELKEPVTAVPPAQQDGPPVPLTK